MSNLPALSPNAPKSATPFSEMSLTASLPKWLAVPDLDIGGKFYQPPIPHGQGNVLRRAAAYHHEALEPCGEAEATELLEHLRFVTKLNNESEMEKRVTMNSLAQNLCGVPTDILVDGLAAYVNFPGQRWFPKSAGEIRLFTDGLVLRRKLRVTRLCEMAAISDRTPDPAAVRDSWNQPIPLSEVSGENELYKFVGSKMRHDPDTGLIYQMQPGDLDPCFPPEQALTKIGDTAPDLTDLAVSDKEAA